MRSSIRLSGKRSDCGERRGLRGRKETGDMSDAANDIHAMPGHIDRKVGPLNIAGGPLIGT